MSNKLLSPTGESASASLIDLVDEGLKLRQELKDVLADAKRFMEGDSDSHHQQQQQQQGQQHNQSQHPKQQLGGHMYRRTRASQWPLGGPHSPTNSIVSTTSSLEMRANQMRLMNASRMGTSFLPANESKSLSTRYPPTSKNNRIMSTPLNHAPKQEEMSRRDNMKRIFVGNLPPDVRSRDIDDLFYKFGKIAFIDLKTRRGPPFAFVEFQDYRDAEEAVKARDGKKFDGYRLRVEFPRGRERPSRFKNGGSGSHRSGVPTQKHSKYRVKVSNLPASGSWQDLKDHMREIGEVCFADVYKNGEGVVEFVSYDDMRYAIRKLNDTKFKSHEGESSYIKLREDIPSRSRSRSRTPTDRSRSRIKSRSRSPVYNKSPVRSYRKSSGESRSRSRSRTPRSGGRSKSRSYSNSMSGSPARDKSPAVRSNGPHGRSRSPRDRSRSASKSHSRSSSHDRSIHDSPHSARSRSPRSNSRTPTPVEEKD